MMIKKLLILVVLFMVAVGVFVFSRLSGDKKAPTISIINEDIEFTCSTSLEELLKNATASDESGIKAFFIEENDLIEIIESKKLTYVAIDTNNNVAKESFYIKFNDAVTHKKIVQLKPLKMEVNKNFLVSDYFAVENDCGCRFDNKVKVEGMDLKTIGEYEIKATVVNNDSIEAFEGIMRVNRFSVPLITLKEDTVEIYVGQSVDTYSLIESIEDDKDSEELLFKNLTIDTSGFPIDKTGTFPIIYNCEDSDGNVGTVTLRVIVSPLPQEATECINNGGSWDYYWNTCYYGE